MLSRFGSLSLCILYVCMYFCFSPADDDLLSRLWIVVHQVKPLAQSGVAAVHWPLPSPETFDYTGRPSSITPLATAAAAATGAHTAPKRYQDGVGVGGGAAGARKGAGRAMLETSTCVRLRRVLLLLLRCLILKADSAK